MAEYSIYKATNKVNGKIYVGVTVKSLAYRTRDHISESKRDNYSCKKFHAAIRKYGEAAFVWGVIDTVPSFDEAMAKEVEWISKLKPEYNICRGGRGAPGAMTGKTHSEKTRTKLREWGRARIDLFKEYQAMGPVSQRKKVLCTTTGKIYDSVSEASKDTGADRACISEICNRYKNGRKHVKGLAFSYNIGDHSING